jgi:hypothetical protein
MDGSPTNGRAKEIVHKQYDHHRLLAKQVQITESIDQPSLLLKALVEGRTFERI